MESFLGLLVPLVLLGIVLLVVRKIISTPVPAEYDLPPNKAGKSRFDPERRRVGADAASRLPADIKRDRYDEIMVETGGLAGGELIADRVSTGALAYLSGFELMMRGIPVKLIVEQLNVEFGGAHPGEAFAPTSTYTTQTLAPHMDEIASVEGLRALPSVAGGSPAWVRWHAHAIPAVRMERPPQSRLRVAARTQRTAQLRLAPRTGLVAR